MRPAILTSFREILTRIIDLKAPDDLVSAEQPQSRLTDDGRVIRRDKIGFLLARSATDHQSLGDFVDTDVDDVLGLFRVFNDGTHGDAGALDVEALQALKGRVEGAIRFLSRSPGCLRASGSFGRGKLVWTKKWAASPLSSGLAILVRPPQANSSNRPVGVLFVASPGTARSTSDPRPHFDQDPGRYGLPMTKRVRAQRIEERSREAFKAALDERFLFRDDTPDFGIDGSVEEFDDRDTATGLRYFVQLKATDGEDLDEALKRSIPIEHANLYSSLTLPILMVRYVAARDGLYVRWWGAFSAAGPAPPED